MSIETEQQLLGCLFKKPGLIDDIMQIVSVDDFQAEKHRRIYSEMMNAKTIDLFAIGERIGDVAYCGQLAKDLWSTAQARTYAKIVRDYSLKLQAEDIAKNLLADTRPINSVIETATAELNQLADGHTSEYPDTGQMITDALQDAINRFEGGTLGVQTGFKNLDKIIPGLEGGDYVVVAGRPSMGKTTFALNLADKVDGNVVFFSMEQPGKQIFQRLMANRSNIPLTRIRAGNLKDDEWKRLMDITVDLKNSGLIVDDRGGLSPHQIKARLRIEKRRRGISLAVIDYIQLMQLAGKENRTNEVSEISRNLKAIAKEIEIPIVVLSQLNRGLEQRQDKRPVMSDLRESGSIEQDADIICFVYRDEVYNPDTPNKNIAEVIVRKQRNGPLGTAYLNFQPALTLFTDFYGDIPRAEPVKTKSYGDF